MLSVNTITCCHRPHSRRLTYINENADVTREQSCYVTYLAGLFTLVSEFVLNFTQCLSEHFHQPLKCTVDTECCKYNL